MGLLGAQGAIEAWWVTVSVSSRCYNKTPPTRWLVRNKSISLTLKLVNLFLAVLDLRCHAGSSLVSSVGYCLALCGLLIAVASHFQAWAVGSKGFSSCGSQALQDRLNSCGSQA